MIVQHARDMWAFHIKRLRKSCITRRSSGIKLDIAIMSYQMKKSLVQDASQRTSADIMSLNVVKAKG